MSAHKASFIYTRRSPRIITELPADFRILSSNHDIERYSINTKTLSDGGLSFLSPVLLQIGDEIEMRIQNPGLEITFSAEVTWIEKVGDFQNLQYKCGLKFTRISEDDLAKVEQIVSGNSRNPSSLS